MKTGIPVFFLLVVFGCGSPSIPEGEHWRVGIYQGGEYHDYRLHLTGFIQGLSSMNLVTADLPDSLHSADSLLQIWLILGEKACSPELIFAEDGFWDARWQENTRDSITEAIVERTGPGGDIDLMIAMGTWAGQDLAEAPVECPVIVMSTSNPVQAGIVSGFEFSGQNNIHATTNPDRYTRRLITFHRILQFESLGLVYEDTPTGRIYSNVEDFRNVASDMGFRIVERHLAESQMSPEEAAENLAAIYSDIAEEVDAVIFTALECEQPEYFPVFLPVLLENGIFPLAQLGESQVAQGALIGISERDHADIGGFYAEVFFQILQGTPPGDIPQVFEDPLKLSLNLETAERIGYCFPGSIISTADTVFNEIGDF